MKVSYALYTEQRSRNFIRFEASFPTLNENTFFSFSAWRPGRYEEGNFVKNVKNLKFYNEGNEVLPFEKIGKDTWKVNNGDSKFVRATYIYFGKELNAGSTYADDRQLSVNPVNSFIYTPDCFEHEFSIELHIPDTYQIATSLNLKGRTLNGKGVDELFDSPFIASADLIKLSYEIEPTTFYIWFNGLKQVDFSQVLHHFKAFSRAQMEAFGHFPSDVFHFFIQCLPQAHYHGVEHLKSTMIALGPSVSILEKNYSDLLGVSSHELYHVWNVKSMRPADMHPYRYQENNHSKLGYIYEGVTTFMGDYFLLKSGVFKREDYLHELRTQVQKHFDNPGRFAMSVADSSWDTWIDGYVSGTPGRKVSIYNEGSLLAFMMDFKIREATKNQCSLQTVMKRLYVDFGLQSKGYTEIDYLRILQETSGLDLSMFFKNFVHGTSAFEPILMEALTYYGIELNLVPSKSYQSSHLGLQTQLKSGRFWVQSITPGSPAELGGLSENDKILGLNGIEINSDLDSWLNYFSQDAKLFLISRAGRLLELQVLEENKVFNPKYELNYLKRDNVSHQIQKNRNSFGLE